MYIPLVETARGAVWVGNGCCCWSSCDVCLCSFNAQLDERVEFTRILFWDELAVLVVWLNENNIPLLSCISLVIAASHTTMHGSMNFKFINCIVLLNGNIEIHLSCICRVIQEAYSIGEKYHIIVDYRLWIYYYLNVKASRISKHGMR